MPANNRIFYATQAVLLEPQNSDGSARYGNYIRPKGVQSVGAIPVLVGTGESDGGEYGSAHTSILDGQPMILVLLKLRGTTVIVPVDSLTFLRLLIWLIISRSYIADVLVKFLVI